MFLSVNNLSLINVDASRLDKHFSLPPNAGRDRVQAPQPNLSVVKDAKANVNVSGGHCPEVNVAPDTPVTNLPRPRLENPFDKKNWLFNAGHASRG